MAQLKAEQLAAQLERGLAPLYTLYGDEPLLVIEAGDAIRAAARHQGFSEREVLVAGPGFNWNQLAQACGNLSLFGERKLIDLRIPTGKPGREGGQALQEFAQRLSPDILVLITLPELSWQEEKSAWFTALTQAGTLIKLNAPPLAELPAWIAGRLQRQGQSGDRDALQFIAERVEGNLLAAHQEIQKIGLLYPPGPLSLEQVREAVLNVARYDIDDLRAALLAGDMGRLCRTLDGLRQEGEAPPLVLWALTEELRALAAIKTGLVAGRPLDLLCKEQRVWGPRQAAMKRALQRLDLHRLVRGLAQAARIDRCIKGLEPGNVWEAFLRLGLSLSV